MKMCMPELAAELSAAAPSSNRDFLYALAGELNDDERLWTCTFSADPSSSHADWNGQSCTYAEVGSREVEMDNTYYSVAVFKPDPHGTLRRQTAHMVKMFVVVLDDIGTKGDAPTLQPSYKLETSPGNFQFGYRLASPITDPALARRLLQQLSANGRISDHSGNNPVRYVRLPFGANKKAAYGTPFRHRLAEWRPDRSFHLAEICDTFGLDSEFITTCSQTAANGTSSLAGHDILQSAPEYLRSNVPDEMTSQLAGMDFSSSPIPSTPENEEIVAAMLKTIPPDRGPGSTGNREQWLHILWAVASLGWDNTGENLCRQWSQTGGLYNSQAFELAYRSYDRRENGITFGTLVKHAKDAGYNGPLPLRAAMVPTAPAPSLRSCITDSGHERGDVLNATLFASRYRGKFKYVFERAKWMQWDDQRWIWCAAGEEVAAAKATVLAYAAQAADHFKTDQTSAAVKQAISHATKSQDAKRLDAMLKLAASEPGMGIGQMAMLDADPMLLGVANGVVDLSCGTLLLPSPKMLITRQCHAAFDRDAKCPAWIAFLDACFPNDPDMIRYLQKAMGYTLTGDVSEEVMHFCYGTGRNGKSVMANVLHEILGDYAMMMRTESLMRGKYADNGQSNDIARLAGARLVLANETRVEQCLDDARLKELVSTETISARFLHREFFEFKPTHKLWVRGNHKPRIADTSDGAWRRVRLIPFSVQVPEGQVDPKLEKTLLAERDGILAWMVAGCLLWRQEGLQPCATVAAASQEYREESDILGQWLAEACRLGPTLEQDQQEVWRQWQIWCNQNGHHAGTKNTFTRKLKDRDIEVGKRSGKRTYRGIECKPGGQADIQEVECEPDDSGRTGRTRWDTLERRSGFFPNLLT